MAPSQRQNVELAREIIGRYPRRARPSSRCCTSPRSRTATSPRTPWSTSPSWSASPRPRSSAVATFYEMFKDHPVGTYLVGVCTNLSCMLLGADELLEHAEETLGIKAGSTTPDGLFTLEEVECLAACGGAPCLQVNYRYFENVTNDDARRHRRRPARRPRPGRRGPAAPRHALPRDTCPMPMTAADRGSPRGDLPDGTDRTRSCSPGWAATTPTPRGLPGHRGLRRAAQGAHHDARGGARAGQAAPPRRWPDAAAPGFPTGQKWSLLATAYRATSSSTATRASRAPSRTASSWSAIPTR